MRETITVQGFELKGGDRVLIKPVGAAAARHFKRAAYAVTFVGREGTYVGMHRSPRPGRVCRDGFGQNLDYFKDKKIVRRLRPLC